MVIYLAALEDYLTKHNLPSTINSMASMAKVLSCHSMNSSFQQVPSPPANPNTTTTTKCNRNHTSGLHQVLTAPMATTTQLKAACPNNPSLISSSNSSRPLICKMRRCR